MKNQKIQLTPLKVKSFITILDINKLQTIKGGRFTTILNDSSKDCATGGAACDRVKP